MPILLSPPNLAPRPFRQSDFDLQIAAASITPIWLKMASNVNANDEGVFGYAGASTSQSPPESRNCFCGNEIRDGEGIYCSAGCARSDAFSTLCNKPNPPSLASSIALGSSTINSNSNNDASVDTEDDWESTHYGSMCRADLRREERKEERRRRRAEGSVGGSTSSRSTFMSTASSTSSSRVPDLVGGHHNQYQHYSHSRNASVASSRTSYSSNGGLSRNPSVASSSSNSRRGYGFNVDTPIMEDDDEAEWLASDPSTTNEYGLPQPYGLSMPPTIRMPIPTIRGQPQAPPCKRRPSHSHSNSRSQKKRIEPFGMGQDMRDVLEEIIQMEKEFIIDGSSDEASLHGYQSDHQPEAVFTAVFDRPPRTPSPGPLEGKKRISLAPNAPIRGHRKSMSMANKPQIIPQRPTPFTFGHSASLSESHTALYMATASPEAETTRSASPPRMKARNSMTFTPEAAGPVISGSIPSWLSSDLTPSRRKPGQSHSPSTHHPTMSGWKFPNYTNSTAATPTKLSIDTQTLAQNQLRTPTSNSQRPHPNTRPQLLWPPNAGLAPSHFPSSAGSRGSIISVNMEGTPARPTEIDNSLITSPSVPLQGQGQQRRQRQRQGQGPRQVTPPNSGLRLGVLLGSGTSEGMDLDERDSMSSIGHAFEYGFGSRMGRSPSDSVSR